MTAREIIAHLSGWDDASIAFIHSPVEGRMPATPAARGTEVVNAETVATREGSSYDHIYREYLGTRKVLPGLIRTLPEQKITQVHTLPWDGEGTLVEMVDIFAPHEQEHAEDVRRMIELHR